MLGLIVELCVERNKIFVIEEPEANLHPEALRSLLKLVKIASEINQVIIATHSNVVLRELVIKGRYFAYMMIAMIARGRLRFMKWDPIRSQGQNY